MANNGYKGQLAQPFARPTTGGGLRPTTGGGLRPTTANSCNATRRHAPLIAPPFVGQRPYEVEPIYCSDGYFAVDWTAVGIILEGFYRGLALNGLNTKIVKKTSSTLPDVTVVETDWKAIRLYAKKETDRVLKLHRLNLYTHFVSMRGFKFMLKGMLKNAKLNQKVYGKTLRSAHDTSMTSIKSTVSKWQTAKDVAQFVEKASAAVLIVGSMILTAGGSTSAAVGFLGMGSTLKANAKYRETGSVGATALEFTSNMLLTLIPSPGAKEVLVLAFTDGSVETAKTLLEGKSIQDALASGGMKFTNPIIGKLFGTPEFHKLLHKSVFSATTKVLTDATVAVAADYYQSKYSATQKLNRKRVLTSGTKKKAKFAVSTDETLFDNVVNQAIFSLPKKCFSEDIFPLSLR